MQRTFRRWKGYAGYVVPLCNVLKKTICKEATCHDVKGNNNKCLKACKTEWGKTAC